MVASTMDRQARSGAVAEVPRSKCRAVGALLAACDRGVKLGRRSTGLKWTLLAGYEGDCGDRGLESAARSVAWTSFCEGGAKYLHKRQVNE